MIIKKALEKLAKLAFSMSISEWIFPCKLRHSFPSFFGSTVYFLRKDVWNALRDRERSQLAKVDVLCRYLVETLGLRHPSEPTFASVAAVAQCFVNAGNDLTSLLGT